MSFHMTLKILFEDNDSIKANNIKKIPQKKGFHLLQSQLLHFQ